MSGVTLLASDLHDGNVTSHTERLLRLLIDTMWDSFIFVGDLTDSDNCLSYQGRVLLNLFRHYGKNREVILLPGNHDPRVAVLAATCHVKSGPFCLWEECGRRFLVTHGHKDPYDGSPWDPYLGGYSAPTALGNQVESDVSFYGGPIGRWLAKSAHRMRRWVCDCSGEVRRHALASAVANDCDWVICGHTHYPEFVDQVGRDPGYVNLGSWCQKRDTYCVIQDGTPRLITWDS